MECFLAGDPAIFPFHTHYGFHKERPWNGAFHMDSMEEPTSNSMENSIKWAIKNTITIRNRTLDFGDVAHAPALKHCNSWTMRLLKDNEHPSLNHALDWSCPKRTLGNANARFGRD